MIDTIKFGTKTYPKFQASGFAARFAFPFAMEVCQGRGLDIGCAKVDWAFPGAFLVDPALEQPHDNQYNAMSLPKNIHRLDGTWDYIFSSHCLEHLDDWVGALDHWLANLTERGTLFLYLPHPNQKYWMPWNNRKHKHSLNPEIIREFLDARMCHHIFVSGCDLNDSFIAMAQK